MLDELSYATRLMQEVPTVIATTNTEGTYIRDLNFAA